MQQAQSLLLLLFILAIALYVPSPYTEASNAVMNTAYKLLPPAFESVEKLVEWNFPC